jgi:hypothetical protein
VQVTVDGWRGPGWRAYGAHPRHIKAVRDWIARAVASHGCPVDPGIAALAVSELFTNAILPGAPMLVSGAEAGALPEPGPAS